MKKPAINITVPFSYKGHHYQGVSLADGVSLGLVDAPCGPARKLLSFSNCAAAPTGILADGVSCIDDKSPAVPVYLLLKPDA
jgi:hypothetical protein